MQVLLGIVAAIGLASFERVLPLDVTPIADLDHVERLRHAEVLQVRRDFGQPNVNVALDAWMPESGAPRIEAVRVWWSDEVDRYPFSERLREHVKIGYERLAAQWWRITVAGEGKRFAFDVGLHDGKPAVYADVAVGRRTIRRCRATSADLYAKRFLGIPVGLQAMVVSCTAPDGTQHRAAVRPVAARRR